MATAAIVLAAGMGTRFKSQTPKVLHRVAGRSLLGHVLDAVHGLDVAQVIVVVGHGADEVRSEVAAAGLANATTALQAQQNGTGHAVQMALPALDAGIDDVIILAGDTPLVTTATLAPLTSGAPGSAAVLTAVLDDPQGYGRIVRDGGSVARIVEHRDASPEELAITEWNTGMYRLPLAQLREAVAALGTSNDQGELYLTDVIADLHARGIEVAGLQVDAAEVVGVNDRVQLAEAGAALRRRHAEHLMREGATIVDPSACWLDVTVTVGIDSVILPGTILEGATTIGARATVGPNSHLVDTSVADGAVVRQSVAQGATIGPDANVGPWTYLRPGAVLERGAKAGGFVEIKKSVIGEGSKVPHLSYIGDATIGKDVNIGAGTITCNYDGFDKHKTIIGDGAFIGSDTMLIAPVEIGAGAVTGAGSALSHDVPADALGVERNKQKNVEGWAQRQRDRNAPTD
ncbi:MAG: bifunctional UDP-N-acetylglucosamine pyrophosphorylase/glucosamine-1-phosphate N-acetyltransferase [Glaciecola sp.]|jgi:bifunctional UDP-N-acetylglucosamine pyrophosphorylase/glucosamine-1-phosphate N-acetyltransferase